jgi:hypothetical protein
MEASFSDCTSWLSRCLRSAISACSASLARTSLAVRSSTAASSWSICCAACWVASHLAVSALASWRTSMLSNGFFRISSRSRASSRVSTSSQDVSE